MITELEKELVEEFCDFLASQGFECRVDGIYENTQTDVSIQISDLGELCTVKCNHNETSYLSEYYVDKFKRERAS
jgi:hypothetical protein